MPSDAASLLPVPGPVSHFLVGNLPDQRKLGVLPYTEYLAKNHGDLVRFKLGPLTTYLVTHPRDIEHILLRHKERYEKGVGVRKLKLIMGNGLFLSEGEFWKAQRKLMQPPFTPRGVGQFVGDVMAAVQRLSQRLEKSASHAETIDMQQEMMRLALDVVSQAMFGTFVGSEAGEVAGAFAYILHYVSKRSTTVIDIPLFVPTAANRRFKRAQKSVLGFLDRLIEERISKRADRDDLLSRLLNVTDEETGHRMTRQQLIDEVVTLFFAGHETTAQALTWLWLLLTQNPDKRTRLEAELDAVLGGREVGLADVPLLPYTRAVVDEAMRLYPPVWTFVRQALVEDEVRGYRIDKGAMIMVSPYIVHRDPRYFDEPEAFVPERFLPDAKRPIAPFTYFPFGGGPRVCIGNNFALLEMVLTVATVAQALRFERTDERPVQAVAVSTLRPDRPVTMRAVARTARAAVAS